MERMIGQFSIDEYQAMVGTTLKNVQRGTVNNSSISGDNVLILNCGHTSFKEDRDTVKYVITRYMR